MISYQVFFHYIFIIFSSMESTIKEYIKDIYYHDNTVNDGISIG